MTTEPVLDEFTDMHRVERLDVLTRYLAVRIHDQLNLRVLHMHGYAWV